QHLSPTTREIGPPGRVLDRKLPVTEILLDRPGRRDRVLPLVDIGRGEIVNIGELVRLELPALDGDQRDRSVKTAVQTEFGRILEKHEVANWVIPAERGPERGEIGAEQGPEIEALEYPIEAFQPLPHLRWKES